MGPAFLRVGGVIHSVLPRVASVRSLTWYTDPDLRHFTALLWQEREEGGAEGGPADLSRCTPGRGTLFLCLGLPSSGLLLANSCCIHLWIIFDSWKSDNTGLNSTVASRHTEGIVLHGLQSRDLPLGLHPKPSPPSVTALQPHWCLTGFLNFALLW